MNLLLSKKYLVKINLFKIKSGQTQEEWEAKGWIHQDDPEAGLNGIVSIISEDVTRMI